MLATAVKLSVSGCDFVKEHSAAHKRIVGIVIGWLGYQDGINALQARLVSVDVSIMG